MMTLLRGLHAIAAQRGDGLRPELLNATMASNESEDIDQALYALGQEASRLSQVPPKLEDGPPRRR